MSTSTATVQGLLPEVTEFLSTSLHKAFVNGDWIESKGGQTFEVVDPGQGEKIATVTSLQKEDVDPSSMLQ